MGPLEILKLFFSLTVGGILLGLLFGIVGSYILKKITNDPILTVNTTFISCYLIYFVAENIDLGFEVSGIMALVSMALYMGIFGKTRISSEDIHFVEVFWKYIVYAAESTIFLIAGMIVAIRVLNQTDSFI
jgi:NhaP-type Na+/H+ or K+/H+ antiporter